MKKVLDSVKNVFGDTTALLGEGYTAATEMLNETLQHFIKFMNATAK